MVRPSPNPWAQLDIPDVCDGMEIVTSFGAIGDSDDADILQTPRTWGQMFPESHAVLVVGERSVVDDEASASADEYEAIVEQVTGDIIENRTATALGVVFPFAPRHLPEKRLTVGVRAFTCLGRLTDSSTLAGVLSTSVRDIFDVRGVGLGTVQDIVGALVRVSSTGDQSEPPSPVHEPAEAELPPAIRQLIDDVLALSRWRRVRGQSIEPLFEIRGDDAAPEQLQDILTRLETLTADDFPTAAEPSAFETLTAFYDDLDDRDKQIFRDRIVSPVPVTLQAVADDWDVSRERIRQLESKLQTRVTELRSFGTPVGDLLAALRAEITPVASLERLLSRHPELREEFVGFSSPMWQVLDGIDDNIKVTDGWAATPDTDVSKAKTHEFLLAFADEHGVVDPKSLPPGGLGAGDEQHAWLQWCGYDFFRGRILTNTRNLGDHAASVLSVHGEPMSAEDIFAGIDKDRSFRSFLNQLGGDPRFTRTSKSEWALADWDVAEYGSIRAQIARVVDENGGALDVDELVDAIATRFGVAASSVRTYAATGDFMLERGVVSRRTVAAAPRKAPEDTRGFYRDGTVWRLAIVANKDHLRGSGFAVPSGVARLLAVDYGASTELHSRLGAQAVRWKGVQPGCGSIRRFLQELNTSEGDRVFLEFRDDNTFDVIPATPLPAGATSAAAALHLTGKPDVGTLSEPEIVSALAEALGIPGEDRARRVLSAARGRDEVAIVELLEEAWVAQR